MSEPIEATIGEMIEGELLSVGTPARLLDVGYQCYVRADEIVAIYDRVGERDEEGFAIQPITAWNATKSVILLRNGCTIPGNLSAATLRKRWEAAMGVGG